MEKQVIHTNFIKQPQCSQGNKPLSFLGMPFVIILYSSIFFTYPCPIQNTKKRACWISVYIISILLLISNCKMMKQIHPLEVQKWRQYRTTLLFILSFMFPASLYCGKMPHFSKLMICIVAGFMLLTVLIVRHILDKLFVFEGNVTTEGKHTNESSLELTQRVPIWSMIMFASMDDTKSLLFSMIVCCTHVLVHMHMEIISQMFSSKRHPTKARKMMALAQTQCVAMVPVIALSRSDMMWTCYVAEIPTIWHSFLKSQKTQPSDRANKHLSIPWMYIVHLSFVIICALHPYPRLHLWRRRCRFCLICISGMLLNCHGKRRKQSTPLLFLSIAMLPLSVLDEKMEPILKIWICIISGFILVLILVLRIILQNSFAVEASGNVDCEANMLDLEVIQKSPLWIVLIFASLHDSNRLFHSTLFLLVSINHLYIQALMLKIFQLIPLKHGQARMWINTMLILIVAPIIVVWHEHNLWEVYLGDMPRIWHGVMSLREAGIEEEKKSSDSEKRE